MRFTQAQQTLTYPAESRISLSLSLSLSLSVCLYLSLTTDTLNFVIFSRQKINSRVKVRRNKFICMEHKETWPQENRLILVWVAG